MASSFSYERAVRAVSNGEVSFGPNIYKVDGIDLSEASIHHNKEMIKKY